MKKKAYLCRIFNVIKKYNLVKTGDKIFIALSGGKDSAASLFGLKKFIEQTEIKAELVGFHINFCLQISEKVEKIVKEQTKIANIPLLVIKTKDLGIDLNKARKSSWRPICSICGILKRYLMNKIPREKGAQKVATGHHLDDFLVFFFKNLLGQNFAWISKFKPYLESNHPKQLPKIRPLFKVGSKENKEFCKENKIPFIEKDPCPHTFFGCKIDKDRKRWYRTIYEIEKNHKNFRHQMINSIEKMSKFFKTAYKGEIKECKICGEPTNLEICAFCKVFKKYV